MVCVPGNGQENITMLGTLRTGELPKPDLDLGSLSDHEQPTPLHSYV